MEGEGWQAMQKKKQAQEGEGWKPLSCGLCGGQDRECGPTMNLKKEKELAQAPLLGR